MDTYFDSGALIKIYVKEGSSEEVISLAGAEKQIPLFPLHELEIRNALRAQIGRNYLLIEEFEGAITAFNEDIHASRLKQISPDWSFIYKEAEELSGLHTKELLCPALDILHVALCTISFVLPLYHRRQKTGESCRKSRIEGSSNRENR